MPAVLATAAALALSSCAATPGPGGSLLQAGTPPGGLSAIFGGLEQSACPQGAPPEHASLFSVPAQFNRAQFRRSQKATVRLSIRPEAEIRPILRERLAGYGYDLGIFAQFRELETGICTGVLLDSSLVLTAGHCVSPTYWYREKYERLGLPPPPMVVDQNDRFVRWLDDKELAPLLQADFNFERVLIAQAGGFEPTRSTELFSVPVKELISTRYDPDPANALAQDFAIIRLDRGGRDLSAYGLGFAKLRYQPIATGRPLAIVQHPDGGEKKISAGTLKSSRSGRLEYANISTEGGSSGSGIFVSDGGLAGVHTLGGCGVAEVGGTNKGMALRRIKPVLDDLRRAN